MFVFAVSMMKWRIQDFSEEDANSWYQCDNLLFCKICVKNCMKMIEFGPRWCACPWHSLWIRHCKEKWWTLVSRNGLRHETKIVSLSRKSIYRPDRKWGHEQVWIKDQMRSCGRSIDRLSLSLHELLVLRSMLFWKEQHIRSLNNTYSDSAHFVSKRLFPSFGQKKLSLSSSLYW